MNIKVYSTHSCPYCKMEKEYLDDNKIEYVNYYVDEDQQKAQEMMEISGQLGVPFTYVQTDDGEEHKILGFQREKLNEVLNIH